MKNSLSLINYKLSRGGVSEYPVENNVFIVSQNKNRVNISILFIV